jgi:hypothetical protein
VTKSHYAKIDFRPENPIAALQVVAELTTTENVGRPVRESSAKLIAVPDRQVAPCSTDIRAKVEAGPAIGSAARTISRGHAISQGCGRRSKN